jgi:aryl-alcohol dehydrogenase-like predicted oxidoreductase
MAQEQEAAGGSQEEAMSNRTQGPTMGNDHGAGMATRKLGPEGLSVSALGYGAMVLTGLYGEVDEQQGMRAIRHALERGVTMLDTADYYGQDGANERLVGPAIAGRRDQVTVATKFGITAPGAEGARRVQASYRNQIWVDARPQRVRPSAQASLARLGVEVIDLYYLHFPDPGVPIEESVGAMAELVDDGLIRHVGLSNVGAGQLRRAAAVHPITAVQVECSLWTREPERALIPTARQAGTGIVAWGPLGTGFLAGNVRLGEGDFRHNAPRFQADNLRRNLDRFAPLRDLARELEVTPAQLALAWLLHQGDDVVPIPGSRRPRHIDANIAATRIRLDGALLDRIDSLAPAGLAAGDPLLP